MVDYKYFFFPLNFLTLALKDTSIYDKIINYCVVNFILNSNASTSELVKSVLYSYHRKRDELPKELVEMIEDICEGIDFSEHEFDWEGNFNPPDYDHVFEAIEEKMEYEDLLLRYSINLKLPFARKTFKFSGGNLDMMYHAYEELKNYNEKFERLYGKDPFVNINPHYLFAVRDKKMSVSEFHFIAAIKTIIGNRNFTKSYKTVIVSRACGARNESILYDINTAKVMQFYNKYLERYQFDKILNTLSRKKLLTKLSAGRGIYISTKLTHEQLVDIIIQRKKHYQESKKQEMKHNLILKEEFEKLNSAIA